jgi:small subunit ribosomal protein S2
VPGNDDASRAINLYCDLMVGAVLDGIQAEMAASGADLGEIEELPEVIGAEDLPAAEEAAPEPVDGDGLDGGAGPSAERPAANGAADEAAPTPAEGSAAEPDQPAPSSA